MNEKRNPIWFIIGGIALMIYILRIPLGILSYVFFSYFDNLFNFDDNWPPVLSWILTGLLAGLVLGAFVAVKKYKLEKRHYLIPLLIVALIITALAILNKPFIDRPDTYTFTMPLKDTTYAQPVAVRHFKKPRRKNRAKPASKSMVRTSSTDTGANPHNTLSYQHIIDTLNNPE